MKFHFDLGTVIALIIFGALAVYAGPAIIQIATLGDQIKVKSAESQMIEAKNNQAVAVTQAETQSKILALPTLQALSVRATESAIENERIKANAQANAQVVAAQGQADQARSVGDAILEGVTKFATAVLIVGAGIVILPFLWKIFITVFVTKKGGHVEYTNTGAHYFPPVEQPKQLPANTTTTTTIRAPRRVRQKQTIDQ